jgi:curved DNA-binding protein CbpA
MTYNMNRFIRPLTPCTHKTGNSLHCYLIVHRRSYADRTSTSNHYDVLGINANASSKEVKAAFYKLSKKHHPDVNPDDVHAAQKFSTISNAYDILGDSVKRRDYDNELLSRNSSSDPYVTYDRTSGFAQRARAHRPSSWKPPPSSRTNANGGFRGAESAFGSSQQQSNYGTFNREQYDDAFGRFRGPTPNGRSNIYNFDEFYRAHYNDFQSWSQARKEAQNRARREQQAKEQQRANRTTKEKASSIVIRIVLGAIFIGIVNLLHDLHFHNPVEELRAKFYIIPKTSTTRSDQQNPK